MAGNRRKRKNLLTVITLVVSFCALVCAYYFVLNRGDSGDDTITAVAGDESCVIFTLPGQQEDDPDTDEDESAVNITEISITNASWSATFCLNEEEVWVLKDDSAFQVNQTKAANMLKYINVKATSMVTETPEDLSEYGLDNPAITITATDEELGSHTLYIGDTNGGGTGYYAKEEGSDTVYVVSSTYYTYYCYSMQDMMAIESAPEIDSSCITALNITSTEFNNLSITYNENASVPYSGMSINTYDITAPYDRTVEGDSDLILTFLENYEIFSFKNGVDYKSENFVLYGLDEPSTTLSIDYYELLDDGTVSDTLNYTLYFGNEDSTGGHYVRAEGSDCVYLMTATNTSSLIDTDADSLVSTYLNMIYIATVDHMEVNAGGTSHTYEILYTTTTDDDGVETTSESGEIVDGVTLSDTSDFKSLYTNIIGAKFTGNIPENATAGDLVLSIEYFRTSDEYEHILLEYLTYNANYYAVSINGELRYTIPKTDIDGYVTAINSFTPQ